MLLDLQSINAQRPAALAAVPERACVDPEATEAAVEVFRCAEVAPDIELLEDVQVRRLVVHTGLLGDARPIHVQGGGGR